MTNTHLGTVRSFDLGGPGTQGRRWAARCRCGALATTDAWSEALAFLTKHLQLTAPPRAVRTAIRARPDLRGLDCWPPVVVGHNGNGRTAREYTVQNRVGRLVSSLARVVLGLPFFATRG